MVTDGCISHALSKNNSATREAVGAVKPDQTTATVDVRRRTKYSSGHDELPSLDFFKHPSFLLPLQLALIWLG